LAAGYDRKSIEYQLSQGKLPEYAAHGQRPSEAGHDPIWDHYNHEYEAQQNQAAYEHAANMEQGERQQHAEHIRMHTLTHRYGVHHMNPVVEAHHDELYEGGIRTPFIARWPGTIKPGTTSDLLTSFVDFLPTAADLCGVPAPPGLDGRSIAPALLGKDPQVPRESLYFEIYEPFFQQAVRMGDWKGYRLGTKAPLELYDLKADPAEKQDIAAAHPDIVCQIEAIMTAEHTPSPHYDAPESGKASGPKTKKTASAPKLSKED
jgi:hypothetical protein